MNSPAKLDLETRTFTGPSIFAPFAAVVGEFPIPITSATSRSLPEALRAALPEPVVDRIQTLNWGAPFETLVAKVAQALEDWHGRNDLPCRTARTPSGCGQVFLGYNSEQATALALQLGYELALAVYTQRSEAGDANSALAARLAQLGAMMERQLGEVARPMTREARARGIPFVPVVPGQRIWLYGQGKYGRYFFGTSNERDSQIGHALQHNKMVSNRLVRRLGFPGVEHSIADNPEHAVQLATQIGYPVVIKPIDSRQGLGVTAGVISEDEVAVAFARAKAVSPGRVLVERFVEGDDFRLTVCGGRLAYALLRSPPQLLGTGTHTIAELIGIENQRRSAAQAEQQDAPKQLSVDADMLATLQKQKIDLNDRVPAGQVVKLRSVPNARGGGTRMVVTDRVHPDNRGMVEAIARCFRLDTVGIDFLTPDITESWRAVPCAVIEVNSSPTFGMPQTEARLILERAFPGAANGRIPSVVVVSSEPIPTQGILSILQPQKLTVGFADGALAALGGQQLFIEQVRLADFVTALLLDSACEALVVACIQDDILREGLPLDRFDVCVIDPQVKLFESVQTLLSKCSNRLITDAPIATALTQWLEELANA